MKYNLDNRNSRVLKYTSAMDTWGKTKMLRADLGDQADKEQLNYQGVNPMHQMGVYASQINSPAILIKKPEFGILQGQPHRNRVLNLWASVKNN